MKFYGSTDKRAAFHKKDCYQLGHVREVVEVTNLLARPVCKSCFPETTKLRVLHRLCDVCGHLKPHPCPHNGGVEVIVDRGTYSAQRRWVWPEQAYRHRLAPAATAV